MNSLVVSIAGVRQKLEDGGFGKGGHGRRQRRELEGGGSVRAALGVFFAGGSEFNISSPLWATVGNNSSSNSDGSDEDEEEYTDYSVTGLECPEADGLAAAAALSQVRTLMAAGRIRRCNHVVLKTDSESLVRWMATSASASARSYVGSAVEEEDEDEDEEREVEGLVEQRYGGVRRDLEVLVREMEGRGVRVQVWKVDRRWNCDAGDLALEGLRC